MTSNIYFALIGIAFLGGAIFQLFRMFKSSQVMDILGIVYTKEARPERFWLRFVICIAMIPIGLMFLGEATHVIH